MLGMAVGEMASSPDQHRSSIHIEDFSGNESGVRGAEEQNRRGELFGRAYAAERNLGENDVASFGITQSGRGHVSGDPSRGYGIYVNAIDGEFGGKSLDHANERALAGGVVTVKSFATLSGGGADEDNVSGHACCHSLLFHLGDGMFDQGENAVEIDGHGAAPLCVGHLVDGRILRGPNSVIDHENVEASETFDRGVN